MKLAGHHNHQFVFEFSEPEKSLLLATVALFPLVPLAHPRRQLNPRDKTSSSRENEHLLKESLRAQQEESRQWVAKMQEPARFKATSRGFHLLLTRLEIEELLQVLNDVRVGSWMALGSPDTEGEERMLLSPETSVHVKQLELAGLFQMFFLKALGRAEE